MVGGLYRSFAHLSVNCGCCLFFFFNDTATTEIYTLSLHDALPISCAPRAMRSPISAVRCATRWRLGDRKSTRLNSSHGYISYAVFCLKKKTNLAFPISLHLPTRASFRLTASPCPRTVSATLGSTGV